MFRLQKYKKFESNSQLVALGGGSGICCFDCKSTKNLRAIHNRRRLTSEDIKLFRLQKYKKFESNSQPGQFVRGSLPELFRLQKYKKFESNSQRGCCERGLTICCFDCKSTKNLRAIHNKVQSLMSITMLFRLQKYKKFESNSQQCLQGKRMGYVVSTAKVQKI